ncbi:MAG: topoisomerase DNA-binding C4 zinc finger domain-containing protein, partial [Candidatus Hermodarchaeota archaeon]
PDCKNDLFIDDSRGYILSCKGCKFTLSLNRDDLILCPICSKPLKVRTGTYGRFLGCSGYPNCRFASNLESSYSGRQRDVFCPKCGSVLELSSSSSGGILKCAAHPACDFTYKF